MLSKNTSRLTFSKQLQAVVTYFKLENNYAVMTASNGNMFNNMTIVDDFKALDTTYVYEGETYDWYSGSVFKTLHCLDGDITYE